MREHRPLLGGALAGIALAAGSGCFNGSLHDYHDFTPDHEIGRFELVIEPGRTSVDGTHFLLDTATGDVWRMDSPDGREGEWVRLGDAPEDAQELEVEVEEVVEEDAA